MRQNCQWWMNEWLTNLFMYGWNQKEQVTNAILQKMRGNMEKAKFSTEKLKTIYYQHSEFYILKVSDPMPFIEMLIMLNNMLNKMLII